MKLKPLGDRLIVRAIEEEQTTGEVGLVLPDTAKEKPQMGEVLAAGDGKLDDSGKRIPMDVKKGDKVPVQQVRRDRDQRPEDGGGSARAARDRCPCPRPYVVGRPLG